ncbi:MAG: hypothetical protein GY952_01405, partial [Rhodobacteraceae bacterium]|nr:hypothetical protein [Paracoccaceae bacterium]
SELFGIPVRIIEDRVASEASERRKAEAAQREKDDLAAQQGMNAATQSMNEATQSMKHASWVSAGLVFLGTCLLIWTLMLTRQANRAAQAAVNATREIGQKQVRAYVGGSEIDDQSMFLALNINYDNGKYNIAEQEGPRDEINLVVTNFGQTPARNIRHVAVFDVRTEPFPIDDADRIFPTDDSAPPKEISLPAGGEFALSCRAARDIPAAQILGAINPECPEAIYVIGVIEYEDVFEGNWYTKFSLFADFAPLKDGMGENHLAITWRLTKSHNKST